MTLLRLAAAGLLRPQASDESGPRGAQRLAHRAELGGASQHETLKRFPRGLGEFLHALGCCQRASEMVPARVGTLRTWRRNVSSVRWDASTARWKESVPNFRAPQRALGGVLRVLGAMQRVLQETQRAREGVQNTQG